MHALFYTLTNPHKAITFEIDNRLDCLPSVAELFLVAAAKWNSTGTQSHHLSSHIAVLQVNQALLQSVFTTTIYLPTAL